MGCSSKKIFHFFDKLKGFKLSEIVIWNIFRISNGFEYAIHILSIIILWVKVVRIKARNFHRIKCQSQLIMVPEPDRHLPRFRNSESKVNREVSRIDEAFGLI